jgi:Tol biopolymer transport system component
MDSNGDNRELISIAGAIDYQPRWSPDGKHIVFVSVAGDRPSVFIENIDPLNLLRTESSRVPSYTTMSPDWSINDYILCVLGSRGQVIIYKNGQQTADIDKMALSPAYQGTVAARFSPDGQWVLFDMNIKQNRDIYLLPIVGAGDPRRVTTDRSIETDPAWQPIPAGS